MKPSTRGYLAVVAIASAFLLFFGVGYAVFGGKIFTYYYRVIKLSIGIGAVPIFFLVIIIGKAADRIEGSKTERKSRRDDSV